MTSRAAPPGRPGMVTAAATRHGAAAAVWLLVPAMTLLAPRGTRGEALFRVEPANASYEAMFVAAAAGAGLAAAWTAGRIGHSAPLGTGASRVEPLWPWWNALAVFDLLATTALAATHGWVGVPGTAVAWALSAALLSALSARHARAARVSRGGAAGPDAASMVAPPARAARGVGLRRAATAFLAVAGLAVLAGPVLAPWSGPPEPFVRWQPYAPAAELWWRGVFLAFAVGMLLAATDPLGRHRPFLVLLAASGALHAALMAADNRLAAHRGGPNGNVEHLYGDVLGWAAIAAVAAGLLVASRGSARPRGQPAAQAP